MTDRSDTKLVRIAAQLSSSLHCAGKKGVTPLIAGFLEIVSGLPEPATSGFSRDVRHIGDSLGLSEKQSGKAGR
jgi:hypothetical protein